jgi:hypothetical protein
VVNTETSEKETSIATDHKLMLKVTCECIDLYIDTWTYRIWVFFYPLRSEQQFSKFHVYYLLCVPSKCVYITARSAFN